MWIIQLLNNINGWILYGDSSFQCASSIQLILKIGLLSKTCYCYLISLLIFNFHGPSSIFHALEHKNFSRKFIHHKARLLNLVIKILLSNELLLKTYYAHLIINALFYFNYYLRYSWIFYVCVFWIMRKSINLIFHVKSQSTYSFLFLYSH